MLNQKMADSLANQMVLIDKLTTALHWSSSWNPSLNLPRAWKVQHSHRNSSTNGPKPRPLNGLTSIIAQTLQ